MGVGGVGGAVSYGIGTLAKRVNQPKPVIKPIYNSPISYENSIRIQNAANKTNQTITVVGSRANGTSGPLSDWDYIMSGNSAQRHAAASSIPKGVSGGAYGSGIDIFSSYENGPYPVIVDKSKPYIEYLPKKP